MLSFESYPDCTNCSLYETAKSPGLPTRPLYDGQQVIKDRALLFVGQSPGYQENKAGKIFVGYIGQLLRKMVEAAELSQYCDIYLSNATRCQPPQGGDVSQSQVRACRNFLYDDVITLQCYYEEVILVGLGAKACYSISNLSSLNKALKQQGSRTKLFTINGAVVLLKDDGIPPAPGRIKFKENISLHNHPRMFFTYHPALLHPMRKPALVRAVEAHFVLLRRYLEGKFIPNEDIEEPELGIPVPNKLPCVVSCDIETYGILEGKEQTVFNPIKSKYIDGVDFKDQVVCVNFSWRDFDEQIYSAEYVFNNPKHLRIIRQWFQAICQENIVLVGQNFKFDLMFLASADTELRYWIDPRRLKVDDTLILSFLLYEQQPEKGLKELSMLMGISDYSKMLIDGKHGCAKSPWDKDLHKYNGVDGVTTLKLREELLVRIAERYGDDSEKLSDVCAWMRNTIVWDTFDLDLNGSALNIPKLERFHLEQSNICKSLLVDTEKYYGIKLAGKGSDKPLRSFFLECVELTDLAGDSRVKYTEKTKNISIGVENANLLKKHLPMGEHLQIISNFQEFKEGSKIVNTYTKPLLEKPRKGIVTRRGNIGMVYPSWYPIPSYFDRGGASDDAVGGQTQGRFSCKKPARQTEPHSIRDCSTSRWEGGKLAEYDYNQDHLRMAALLSGDPPLMEVYSKEGESVHLKTAAVIFPNIFCADFKEKYPKEYTATKSLNFLVIFKGGPGALQSLVLRDTGVELDLPFCERAIRVWYEQHPVYKKWQDSIIDLAAKQGYLVLPTGWSRTFGLGPSGVVNYTNEICNFMHQTPCAQLLQAAHYQIILEFRDLHLKTLICLQIYDALFADIYPGEEEVVDEIIIRNMERNTVLDIFYKWTGRYVPWTVEKKEYKL